MKITPLKIIGTGMVALSGVISYTLYKRHKLAQEMQVPTEFAGLPANQERRNRIMRMLIDRPFKNVAKQKIEYLKANGMTPQTREAWNRLVAKHPESLHLMKG